MDSALGLVIGYVVRRALRIVEDQAIFMFALAALWGWFVPRRGWTRIPAPSSGHGSNHS